MPAVKGLMFASAEHMQAAAMDIKEISTARESINQQAFELRPVQTVGQYANVRIRGGGKSAVFDQSGPSGNTVRSSFRHDLTNVTDSFDRNAPFAEYMSRNTKVTSNQNSVERSVFKNVESRELSTESESQPIALRQPDRHHRALFRPEGRGA